MEYVKHMLLKYDTPRTIARGTASWGLHRDRVWTEHPCQIFLCRPHGAPLLSDMGCWRGPAWWQLTRRCYSLWCPVFKLKWRRPISITIFKTTHLFFKNSFLKWVYTVHSMYLADAFIQSHSALHFRVLPAHDLCTANRNADGYLVARLTHIK